MAIGSIDNSFYADPSTLAALKRDASTQSPEALRETARQFESLFTTMMLKSMRDATPGDSLFGSDQQDFYQDMFDQQLSMQLSKGKGLGLADMLVRQLMQGANPAPAGEASVVEPGGVARAWPPRSQDEFVDAIFPAAQAAGRALGVDPHLIVAHAALETGWGRSTPVGSDGMPSFNLFGIKAGKSWHGDSVTAPTREFQAGRMQRVEEQFRSYGSPEESVSDYAKLLQSSPRYAAALGTGSDAAAFGTALQNAGYATDPDYASKLAAVARGLKSRGGLPISANGV